MIEILGLDHIVLRTTQLSTMLKFYGDFLGCKIERELDESVGLVQLRAGSALIDIVPVDSELGRLGGGPPSQDGRNVDHFCLCIADIDEARLLAELESEGISNSGFAERYGAQGFGRSIYIDDPEGNVVELKLELATS